MNLPVVATVEVQGEPVVVRAAPLSLVARLAGSEANGTESVSAVLEVVKRCCTTEGGAPLDLDALTMESAGRLVRVAVGEEGGSDFPKPPGSSEPGG